MMKKKIVVLGGGISGLGAALLAKKKGFTVFLSDNSKLTATTVQILKQHNIKYEECKHTFSSIISADEIIISQSDIERGDSTDSDDKGEKETLQGGWRLTRSGQGELKRERITMVASA